MKTSTFEQLLEMDDLDDVDEREFSRSIILGLFESTGDTLQKIRPRVYAPDSNLRDISTWGHFLKGAITFCLQKLGHTGWEIQVVAGADPQRMLDEFKRIKMQEDQRAFVGGKYESYCEQLKVAKVKLYAFYKVPLEPE